MRELVDSAGGTGGAGGRIEILVVDLIHPAVVLHVDQHDEHVDNVLKVSPRFSKDSPDVFDDGTGLGPDVEFDSPIRVYRNSNVRVVGSAGRDPRDEDQVAHAARVRVIRQRGSAVVKNVGLAVHGGRSSQPRSLFGRGEKIQQND